MATLSVDAVKKIIEGRPEGVEPRDIVQGLIDAGHTLLPPENDSGSSVNGDKGFSVLNTLKNIPSSAGGVISGIAKAVTSPLETARGVMDIASGGISKGISKITGAEPSEATKEDVGKFDAVKQFFVNRYGSIEALKKTIEEDPVGFAMDASTVLSGGGGLLSKAGGMAAKTGGAVSGITKAGKLAGGIRGIGETVTTAGKIAKKAGEASAATGKAIEPINLAGRTTFEALAKTTKLPERIYASALKMSNTLKPEERAARIATGMKEGVIPNVSGLEQLQNKIEAINGEIGAKIEQGKTVGVMISAPDVAKRIDDLIPFFENTIEPAKYIDELKSIKDTFASRGNIPIETAQKIKQNTYSLLRKAYGEMKSVTIEGQKAVARGLKEEIVKIYPEIGELNKRESALLNLEKSVEKAVGRINNRDLIGIGTPIAGMAVGSIAGGEAGVLATLTKFILDNPEVKARTAIALNRARLAGGKAKGYPVGRQALFQAGRNNQNIEKQITEQQASSMLRATGGDKEKARSIAKSQGFYIPQ